MKSDFVSLFNIFVGKTTKHAKVREVVVQPQERRNDEDGQMKQEETLDTRPPGTGQQSHLNGRITAR
jgi:hypothetical protein